MSKITRILCAAAILLVAAGCGESNKFVISGSVDAPELNGRTLYLIDLYGDTEVPIDSVVVAEGRYIFKGTVEGARNVIIDCPNQPYTVRVVLEPGTIVVNGDGIGGTPLNDRLQAYNERHNVDDILDAMDVYYPLYYGARDAAARAGAEHVLDSLDALGSRRVLDADWQLYNENRDNILAVIAMEEIVEVGEFTYGELESIVGAASPMVAGNRKVKEKLEQLRAVEETSVGRHYTDIEGVEGRLSDLIEGRVALVDFWASWCGPCRAEIRDNLVPLWRRYGKRGLVVVGLNVWERGDAATRRAAHERAMSELGVDYPQLVDSTRTATDVYGVRGIPQIMLIDKDGTILARDLRGAAIEEAVVRALGR